MNVAQGLDRLAAVLITGFARVITGAHANWVGCLPEARPRIYYANHASHFDFILIWSVLPAALRPRTRPVAAADYWLGSRLRRMIAQRVFHAVLIDRTPTRESNPIATMAAALAEGQAIILFPEGTRNITEARLLPFKSGLFHVARGARTIELVPVWLENLNRVMPKGEFLPVPLLCTVTFGAPLTLEEGESKDAFLDRTRTALLDLAPGGEA